MVRKTLTLPPLPRYNTIGKAEHINLDHAMKRPLSGYIGGSPSTGHWVNQLSDDWKVAFGCNFAVPCNSATSGLMATCMAADIGYGDEVWVSSYTMSATATAAMACGATVTFTDINPQTFCMIELIHKPWPKAIIVTNLFGGCGPLTALREFCDRFKIVMIEDNAQAPLATHNGKFTGTIGHMGVFSLNVHKHIQCGEGGVVVTDSAQYSERLELAINHGELDRLSTSGHPFGLNLRMAEPIAAIACAQLKKAAKNVQSRIELAENITHLFRDVPFVTPPFKWQGEVHAYYMWAGTINVSGSIRLRQRFITSLQLRGIPFREGYILPLHRLFNEPYGLPNVDEIEQGRIFTFEVCAYSPNTRHLKIMQDIISDEADKAQRNQHGEEEDSRERGDRSAVAVP